MQREGLRKGDCLELYFDSETKPNCTERCTMGSLAWAGSEARPGSGLPPVSSLLAQFHQPDRTLFFLLTPAFSLCSFWKN